MSYWATATTIMIILVIALIYGYLDVAINALPVPAVKTETYNGLNFLWQILMFFVVIAGMIYVIREAQGVN